MKTKLTHWQNAGYDWFEPLNDVCPINEYQALSVSKIPLRGLPPTLMPKVRGAFLVHSGNTGTISYAVMDFHRHDKGLIDLQPLAMCFDHRRGTGVAVSIDHARIPGRTYDPFVTSGLFMTTSGIGLIQCASGLWLQEYAGIPST